MSPKGVLLITNVIIVVESFPKQQLYTKQQSFFEETNEPALSNDTKHAYNYWAPMVQSKL